MSDGAGDEAAKNKPTSAERKARRLARPHPYASEQSPDRELTMDPAKVTLFWGGIATFLVVAGWILAKRFSPHVAPIGAESWEDWTLVPLFIGLALLGFGFIRAPWSKNLTMAGWVLFATYWALTALDLFAKENQDYVNFFFAIVGVYFFVYLAYHQWLSHLRGQANEAVHFLNVATFITAGTYFLIAKIAPFRVWLIEKVGFQTKAGLELFGQGESKGLQFVIDKQDTLGPVTFFYPDQYCNPGRGDPVGAYCREQGIGVINTVPDPATNWFETMLLWAPSGESMQIVPVSIILACTAIQSIMLFVGLFAGTQAHWKRKVVASVIVGAIIYVLNLIRNVGIIWFYGRGYASFWTMHNAIGKGGSLLAMVGIAFAVFRWFPEFFHALVSVLDLPDRDGPIERFLRIGRRRPAQAATA